MSKAWGLLAVVLLAGCGNKKEADRSPIIREEEMPPPKQPVIADPSIDEQLMNPGTVPTPADPDVKPECIDDAALVSWDPAKLRACFDSNDDDQADRCVTWRRDGNVATIDTTFAVEDVDATTEEPEVHVEYRSDQDNNDEERITLNGKTIDVCPYDRACMRIMPRSSEHEILAVLTDPDYKRAVVVMKDYDSAKGIFEMWDLEAGRMRTRAGMKRLVADETYDFHAHMGTGVVIGIADDSNGRALGTILGLDGSFRGELGQGSRNLDPQKTFQHAGVFGIVDIGPVDSDDKPYTLYLHNLASGGAVGKFTIKRDDDGDDDLSFHKLKNGFVGVTQFGEQMRIDMIDLRSKTNRVLLVPGC
ncbi:MAG: hypothetical protein M4D80_11440 [Myxococcota bacterium]|nr:hypothetical protein [Myxococcota bacterium]